MTKERNWRDVAIVLSSALAMRDDERTTEEWMRWAELLVDEVNRKLERAK